MAKSQSKSLPDRGEGGTFRLKGGQHIGPDPDAPEPVPGPDGTTPKRASKTYRVGDVIPADYDLALVHGFNQYERVSRPRPEPLPAPPAASTEAKEPEPDDGLEGFTVAELRDYAEGEEIDLKNAHVKADILRTIRAARKK